VQSRNSQTNGRDFLVGTNFREGFYSKRELIVVVKHGVLDCLPIPGSIWRN